MKTIITSIILLLISMQLSSQEVVSSNGGTAKNAEVEVSWTVGEPVISTLVIDQNILTQGFHQGKLTITAVDEIKQNLNIKVYPNPVTQRVFIDLRKHKNYQFELFNADGKLIKKNILKSTSNEVNVEGLANGTYFLKIHDNKNLVGTYKLVKMY